MEKGVANLKLFCKKGWILFGKTGAIDITSSTFHRTSVIMEEGDPTSPLNLSQSNNLQFYINRNHALATRVDDVPFQTPV
jgi:hypothetical protein